MKPMHILTLATLFPHAAKPNFGIFVERQTAGLSARAGVEVTVINPLGVPPWPLSRNARYAELLALPAHQEWRGLNVYRPRFTLLPKIGGPRNPRMIARGIWPLVKKLHAANPFDLIDAEFFYPDGPAAMRIAARLGIPFTAKARGNDIHLWALRADCAAQISETAEKAAGMLAVSKALKADMVDLGMDGEKIEVHYTGLDHSRFHPKDRAAEKAKLGISGPLMLCVGALIKRKNQALLIRALPQLPDVTLLLAGFGEAEGLFRELADKLDVADRLRFAGSVEHDDLPAMFCAADIMALVSENEGLANAWVEALACGTPVIASNVGGAPELIRSPDAGRIVEPDVDEIVAAAKDLLANPVPQDKVAAQVAHLSWDENAWQVESFFRGLTGQRP
ncbi:MAG: glycosyltransferase [Sphingorhabdus sp.]